MPVIKQEWITRDDLKRNPDRLYIFGDNVVRKGFGGQARAMRGEPNAIGIATKRAPSMRQDAFFYDATFEENCRILDNDIAPAFEALKAGKTVVFPSKGIGTDLARIYDTAPRTAAYLDALIEKLMTYNAPAKRWRPRPRISNRPRNSSLKP